ncbi:MAG: hypothetical protein K0M55_07065 [Rhizobium sp.]|nr:hypothetical protein [Rhizobium sp.]
MFRPSPFLQLLRKAFEAQIAIGQPLSIESLQGAIRILQVCEEHARKMEEQTKPARPLEDDKVVFLDAWLRKHAKPTETL